MKRSSADILSYKVVVILRVNFINHRSSDNLSDEKCLKIRDDTRINCIVKSFFLIHLKNVSLCNDQCWAGQMSVLHEKKEETFTVFLDAINVMNVKLC